MIARRRPPRAHGVVPVQFAGDLAASKSLGQRLRGRRDMFSSAQLVESADGSTWAVTVSKARFAALPKRTGLRLALYNTTLWSGPSFDAAAPYIARAQESARAGEIWMDVVGEARAKVGRPQRVNRALVASLCAATGVAILLACASRDHPLAVAAWPLGECVTC